MRYSFGLIFILVFLLSSPASMQTHAYYNFGMQWKGGFNPQHFGADYHELPGFALIDSLTFPGFAPTAYQDNDKLGGPNGVTISPSGEIFVMDRTFPRIIKFNSSGTSTGWIGKVGTTPTGGAAGCTGTVYNSATPGWCTGGTARTGGFGDDDGGLSMPRATAFDSSGNFYVVDEGTHRVIKYNSSGAFQGWIGDISTSPTGGAAGCAGAAANTATPGWCTGGTARWGSSDGMFYFPQSIAFDSSDNFYVTEYNNKRVSKYNSAGVFQGWIGKIATSPTGGAAGCAGASVGTVTPGWCKGGTANLGTGDGMFHDPNGITVDSSNNLFYVTDSGNYRIAKYNLSGVFQGWTGKILTSPTGGAAGCAGAAVGSVTPGWCTGGTADTGTGDGMLKYPMAITLDAAGNLYVTDGQIERLSKFNSSGVFQGWIGRIATSPTGGTAGCNGASVGTVTPGWCTGGTAGYGDRDGMLSYPTGVAIHSSGDIFVSDSSNHRVNKYSSTGAPLGALQTLAVFTTNWTRTGKAGVSAASDGMFYDPFDLAWDSSGNMIVLDTENGRISKYNSSGAFLGWLGFINASPTGGAAGCNGAAVTTFTPGWCLGGEPSYAYFGNSTDGSMLYPLGMALDSANNIYVTDSDTNQLKKYSSAGAFIGWIGSINISPTGGAAGCNGAAVGNFTPGWCTGGKTNSGSTNGKLNWPNGVAVDSSDNIFVADSGNNRISKYNSSGAFLGWIGKIATSPTGGAAGCNGAAVGTFTPGWCTGGTAASGSGDGMMNYPSYIAFDGSGNIYVSDVNNGRINKYSSTGAFLGWIGKIATSPTGGAAGCSGAAVGSITPGWCTGGTSTTGSGDGMMDGPMGLAVDTDGTLYIADNYNSRILKYSSSGVFKGWYGKITASPTGGDTGCKGAAVGTVTPGWCKGGTSDWGEGNGMLNEPVNVKLDGKGYLYIVDTYNNRLMRIWIRRN